MSESGAVTVVRSPLAAIIVPLHDPGSAPALRRADDVDRADALEQIDRQLLAELSIVREIPT